MPQTVITPETETVPKAIDPLAQIIDNELAKIGTEKATHAVNEIVERVLRKTYVEQRRVRVANLLIDLNTTLRKALICSERLRILIRQKDFHHNSTDDGSAVVSFWDKGISYPSALALSLAKNSARKKS